MEPRQNVQVVSIEQLPRGAAGDGPPARAGISADRTHLRAAGLVGSPPAHGRLAGYAARRRASPSRATLGRGQLVIGERCGSGCRGCSASTPRWMRSSWPTIRWRSASCRRRASEGSGCPRTSGLSDSTTCPNPPTTGPPDDACEQDQHTSAGWPWRKSSGSSNHAGQCQPWRARRLTCVPTLIVRQELDTDKRTKRKEAGRKGGSIISRHQPLPRRTLQRAPRACAGCSGQGSADGPAVTRSTLRNGEATKPRREDDVPHQDHRTVRCSWLPSLAWGMRAGSSGRSRPRRPRPRRRSPVPKRRRPRPRPAEPCLRRPTASTRTWSLASSRPAPRAVGAPPIPPPSRRPPSNWGLSSSSMIPERSRQPGGRPSSSSLRTPT